MIAARASRLRFEVRHARARALFERHASLARREVFQGFHLPTITAACSCDLCLLALPVLVEAKARAAIPIWTDTPLALRAAAIEQGMRDSQPILRYDDTTLERAIRLMHALLRKAPR